MMNDDEWYNKNNWEYPFQNEYPCRWVIFDIGFRIFMMEYSIFQPTDLKIHFYFQELFTLVFIHTIFLFSVLCNPV